jgi:hypothetical protein
MGTWGEWIAEVVVPTCLLFVALMCVAGILLFSVLEVY